ncbi:MAG: glycosyltransferase family 4 protein [Bacteroidetes bacterium]|nr:glycosyltransferase family 4 protein [Bacteroidota bacterium]
MNNNFFALTRYLRDAGYDAHLFYRVGMEHFQPKADTYGNDYASYCHEVDWLENEFHNVNAAKVANELQGFDFYIGQGDEAAVANLSGINFDVYYPYGSDVYKYAQLPQEYSTASKLVSIISSNVSRPTYKQMQRGTMAKYLRNAIVNAKYVLAEDTNESFEAELEKLHIKGEYRKIGLPFIYVNEYEKLNDGFIPQNEYTDRIKHLRSNTDFLLLYHGRQEWKTYHNKFTGKNTHHLIEGFADYIKCNPAKGIKLVMLEYGTDVDASKELISSLGIQDKVEWFPKMYRKDLMYLVRSVDLCCGEFNHSYLTFGTVVEAMLMRKTVITYRQDDLYTKKYSELYPCFNARTPDEITKAIDMAVNNPEAIVDMGNRAYDWVKRNFIEYPIRSLLDIIEKA